MADDMIEASPDGEGSLGREIVDAVTSGLTGVPAPLQRSFFKAAHQLLLGWINVPVSRLDAKARDIKHEQATRERVRSALAAKAIARLGKHPEIVDRALERFTAEVIGAQENLEAVVQRAAQELLAHEASNNSESVTEVDADWLSHFASYAEKASSERAKDLFGRVLAGEIRQGNSFSLFTLDILSKLSQREAAMIVSLAPFVLDGALLLTPQTKKIISFETNVRLAEIGILNPAASGSTNAAKTWQLATGAFQNKPAVAIPIRQQVIVFVSEGSANVLNLQCSMLSLSGQEILSLHDSDIDHQMLQELARDLERMQFSIYLADRVEPEKTLRDEEQLYFQNERRISPAK